MVRSFLLALTGTRVQVRGQGAMTLPEARWRRVEVSGALSEIMEAGEGDPLLFLHAWGLTPWAYEEAVLRLCAAAVRLAPGQTLADVFPPERRRRVRHEPAPLASVHSSPVGS